jgi:hypothetical protein
MFRCAAPWFVFLFLVATNIVAATQLKTAMVAFCPFRFFYKYCLFTNIIAATQLKTFIVV